MKNGQLIYVICTVYDIKTVKKKLDRIQRILKTVVTSAN